MGNHLFQRGRFELVTSRLTTPTCTGVDLSKILGGQTKILGGRRWQKVINAWAFLNYCGASARAAPQVYAYAHVTRTWSCVFVFFFRLQIGWGTSLRSSLPPIQSKSSSCLQLQPNCQRRLNIQPHANSSSGTTGLMTGFLAPAVDIGLERRSCWWPH